MNEKIDRPLVEAFLLVAFRIFGFRFCLLRALKQTGEAGLAPYFI